MGSNFDEASLTVVGRFKDSKSNVHSGSNLIGRALPLVPPSFRSVTVDVIVIS